MRRSAILLLGAGLVWLPSAYAQTPDDGDPPAESQLDPAAIQALRDEAESNSELASEERERVLAVYDETLEAIRRTRAREIRAENYRRERDAIPARVEELREELSEPPGAPSLELPQDVGVRELEARLALERQRLASKTSTLQEKRDLARDSNVRRRELSRALAGIDDELERMADTLRRANAEDAASAELSVAARWRVDALRQAAIAQREEIRAELEVIAERDALIPWLRDEARRQLDVQNELIRRLERRTLEAQRLASRQQLAALRERCRALAAAVPDLEDELGSIEALADTLWGPDGVIVRSEAAEQALTTARSDIAELQRIRELTRRRMEAVGGAGSSVQWWPATSDEFPTTRELKAEAESWKQVIPLVQHQLILYEEQRAHEPQESADTIDALRAAGLPAEDATALETELRRLLSTRREVLSELIQRSGTYAANLDELDQLLAQLVEGQEIAEQFLYERLYWARSVPGSLIPHPGDLLSSFLWLVSPSNWLAALTAAWAKIRAAPVLWLGFVLLWTALVAARKVFQGRLAVLAERVRTPGESSIWTTLEAVVHTLLLALPLPLALREGGLLLFDEPGRFTSSLGVALFYLSHAAGPFEATRQLLRPDGVFEAHFGWRPDVTRAIHRDLSWPLVLLLPPLFVALLFAAAGLDLTSAEELQTYNNSLGRLCFVIAMFVVASSLLGVFRPRLEGIRVRPEFARVSMYAVPIVGFIAGVPAVLAAAGYYLTAVYLSYMSMRTLWLGVILVVLSGVLQRWRIVAFRRAGTRLDADDADEVAEIETKAQHLFRFVVLVAGAVGMYVIWAGAFPALHVLERVQLRPTIAIVDDVGRLTSDALVPSEVAGAADTGADGADASVSDGPSSESTSDEERVLTAWDVLLAILAIIVTVGLVRDVPGLVELVLVTRSRVDTGARIAASTLVRYVILFGGLGVVSNTLNISWASVQWLAAALTFGLGFGLQEIVANFVSGIILLVERPVRVGDAVSIGNLSGRISRIQIRATTITLWDRSEMVVPNKEFITGKLVNWTLSDSKRRIEIPLRVGAGAAVEDVKRILLEIAQAHPAVLDDPPPQVLLLEFADDALKFELWVYLEFRQGLKTKDQLLVQIDEAFRENGIRLGGPSVKVELGEEKKSAVLPQGIT